MLTRGYTQVIFSAGGYASRKRLGTAAINEVDVVTIKTHIILDYILFIGLLLGALLQFRSMFRLELLYCIIKEFRTKFISQYLKWQLVIPPSSIEHSIHELLMEFSSARTFE